MNGNIYIHAAVRVDFDTSAACVMFLGQPVCWKVTGGVGAVDGDTWETFLVAPGAEYAIGGNNDDLAGLIVTSGANKDTNPWASATAIGGTLKVEKTAIKLWGAYKLHLHGVDAVTLDTDNGGGKAVKNGEYVVKGAKVDADAGSANVICVNENGYTDTLADITVDADHDQIARATKVTLGEAGSSDKLVIALYVKDADRPSGRSKIGEYTNSAAKDLYVAVDADTEYTAESADTSTSGATLTLTGVTATSSGTCDGDTGAYAHFKITGYDDITVKQTAP